MLIGIHILITTLNVNRLNTQNNNNNNKKTDCLNGYKSKTCIYAVYKSPISDPGTHTGWKCGGGKKNIPHKQKSKESWSSKLISEIIDIEINNITRDKERVNNDQGINQKRRCKNSKYLHNKCRSTSIHRQM